MNSHRGPLNARSVDSHRTSLDAAGLVKARFELVEERLCLLLEFRGHCGVLPVAARDVEFHVVHGGHHHTHTHMPNPHTHTLPNPHTHAWTLGKARSTKPF